MAEKARAAVAAQRDGSDTVVKCFGWQLKLLRERAGWTQAELGKRLGYCGDQVASVEQARRLPKPELIDAADEVLAAGGMLKVMKEGVAQARYPAFFRDAAKLEMDAAELHVYATQTVPGLLQTEEYARATFTMRRPLVNEELVEQRVAARVARQEIFSRWPAPLMSFVIEEAVLQRPLGGQSALVQQLWQLLSFAEKRNVEVQVMPTGREDNAGLDGPFSLLTPMGSEPIAYVEGQGHGSTITGREEVRCIASRYGIIRAQALTPGESSTFIEKLVGEL